MLISTFVEAGNVDAGSVMIEGGAVTVVAAAAAPEEPPSTGTTEYDAVCRRIMRSMGEACDSNMGRDKAETTSEEGSFILRKSKERSDRFVWAMSAVISVV